MALVVEAPFDRNRYVNDINPLREENRTKIIAAAIMCVLLPKSQPVLLTRYFTNVAITYLARWPSIHQGNFESPTLRLVTKVAMRVLALTIGAGVIWYSAGGALPFLTAFHSVAVPQLVFDMVGL